MKQEYLDASKLWTGCEIDPSSGCWKWTGAKSPQGYSLPFMHGRQHLGHRLSHELFLGPIQSGNQVHHECGTRLCVNPAHLRQLSPAEHVAVTDLRNNGDEHRKKTHCRNGHPYSGYNVRHGRTNKGGPRRTCRTCARESALKAYHAKK